MWLADSNHWAGCVPANNSIECTHSMSRNGNQSLHLNRCTWTVNPARHWLGQIQPQPCGEAGAPACNNKTMLWLRVNHALEVAKEGQQCK